MFDKESKSHSRRRLFFRTQVPMRLIIEGHALPVLNWSLGGVAVAKPCPLAFTPRANASGVLELLAGDVGLSVKVALRLVHEHQDRFGFAFVELTPEQTGMLRALLVWTGASPLERALLPVPRSAQTGQPALRRAPRRRWLHRLAGLVAALVAGLLIAGYALVDKSHIESAHAAVAVPARVVSLTDRGYVDEILVKPGQVVQQGEILMTVRRRAEPVKAISLTSDCPCTILDVTVRHGDEVVAGQPLVVLGKADWGEPFVEALVRLDVDIDVGQEVSVVVEGLPAVGRGRIVRVEAERPTAARFGLAPVLRQDPRYRLVIVSDITGLGPLTPGAAARIRLREDASWSQLLVAEVKRFAGSVTHLLDPDGAKRHRIPSSVASSPRKVLPSAAVGPISAGASLAYDSPTAPSTASAMSLPGRMAPVTTPVPLPSPTKDATEGDPGTPLAETAAISEKPSRPASTTAESASASVSPPAAVSGSANNKMARVQLAARMQGLEPGPPIDLPVRLSQGQTRTIYFFTELRGLSGRSVLHCWEWNGRMMQKRQLHPASQSWRAYTAMTITGDMQGSWRISAVDATTGKVLAGQRFKVERIGNSINQIAHHANIERHASHRELERTNQLLEELQKSLGRIISSLPPGYDR